MSEKPAVSSGRPPPVAVGSRALRLGVQLSRAGALDALLDRLLAVVGRHDLAILCAQDSAQGLANGVRFVQQQDAQVCILLALAVHSTYDSPMSDLVDPPLKSIVCQGVSDGAPDERKRLAGKARLIRVFLSRQRVTLGGHWLLTP